MLSLNICGRRVHLLFYILTFHFIKYLQIWLVSLSHDHIALRVNLSLGFDVLFLSLSLWSESFILLSRLLFKDGSLVNIKWLRLCRRWFPTSVFYNVRARWLALSNIYVSLIPKLSPSLKSFSTCPVHIFFEWDLFGILLTPVVSSFGTSVLNVLPISFVAGASDPSRYGAIRTISSVIWGLSYVRRDSCTALLTVCIFRLTNPFYLKYLELEVVCLKSRTWKNFLYSQEVNWGPLSLTTSLGIP